MRENRITAQTVKTLTKHFCTSSQKDSDSCLETDKRRIKLMEAFNCFELRFTFDLLR